jgi:hypothetical protein
VKAPLSPARPGLWSLAVALSAIGTGACGGGLPLLHPAHVLPKGKVSVGGGLSVQPALVLLPQAAETDAGNAALVLQERTVAPNVAPWVGGRVGLWGSNEAGLAYTGRAVRLDGRHAFTLSRSVSLSAGLGGELILLGRPSAPEKELGGVAGGGFDVPVLVGWNSTGGLYSAWAGPRLGLSWVRGKVALADQITPLGGQHLRAGIVAGLRAGFRHVHVALEIGADFHSVTGNLGDTPVSFKQATLTPAGGLVFTF